jgi:hypothetical protein
MQCNVWGNIETRNWMDKEVHSWYLSLSTRHTTTKTTAAASTATALTLLKNSSCRIFYCNSLLLLLFDKKKTKNEKKNLINYAFFCSLCMHVCRKENNWIMSLNWDIRRKPVFCVWGSKNNEIKLQLQFKYNNTRCVSCTKIAFFRNRVYFVCLLLLLCLPFFRLWLIIDTHEKKCEIIHYIWLLDSILWAHTLPYGEEN